MILDRPAGWQLVDGAKGDLCSSVGSCLCFLDVSPFMIETVVDERLKLKLRWKFCKLIPVTLGRLLIEGSGGLSRGEAILGEAQCRPLLDWASTQSQRCQSPKHSCRSVDFEAKAKDTGSKMSEV